MRETMISMRDVTIRFGDLVANDKVSFDVKRGEILALLGENGAGKSTLMKILYGLYIRESGEIKIDGKIMPTKYAPMDAIELGVSMVPQHFMLIDTLTVAENIILGEEDKISKVLTNEKQMYKKVESLCSQFKINVSPSQKVANLPLGVKQKIEILKALFRGTKVLIFDEPTAVLAPQEVEELFVLLRALQNKGITIIIITHKLHEVQDIADRVMIMRRGKKICTLEKSQTNAKEMSSLMVGKEMRNIIIERDTTTETIEPTIRLTQLNTRKDSDRCNLKNFSLDLFPGKIVGIAGIDGNGQTELLEVMTGVKKIHSGKIIVNENHITENTPAKMRALGIGIIPEDRMEQGLVLDLSIKDNIIIGYKGDERFEKYGVFKSKIINDYVDDLIRKYDIRPTRKDAVCQYLSGGNLQKVVLARELERADLQAVVASQPVRGLDIGATYFTHNTLLELRKEGKAVLLISSDIDEIALLSDYIAVIHDGSIVAFQRSNKISKKEIGLHMVGTKKNGIKA